MPEKTVFSGYPQGERLPGLHPVRQHLVRRAAKNSMSVLPAVAGIGGPYNRVPQVQLPAVVLNRTFAQELQYHVSKGRIHLYVPGPSAFGLKQLHGLPVPAQPAELRRPGAGLPGKARPGLAGITRPEGVLVDGQDFPFIIPIYHRAHTAVTYGKALVPAGCGPVEHLLAAASLAHAAPHPYMGP